MASFIETLQQQQLNHGTEDYCINLAVDLTKKRIKEAIINKRTYAGWCFDTDRKQKGREKRYAASPDDVYLYDYDPQYDNNADGIPLDEDTRQQIYFKYSDLTSLSKAVLRKMGNTWTWDIDLIKTLDQWDFEYITTHLELRLKQLGCKTVHIVLRKIHVQYTVKKRVEIKPMTITFGTRKSPFKSTYKDVDYPQTAEVLKWGVFVSW